MRFFNRFCVAPLCAALVEFAVRLPAAPLETRASHLGAVAVGMGKVMRLSEFLTDYPGGRTALSYLKLDRDGMTEEAVESFRIQSDIADRMKRDFWPQIALETETMSLRQFSREMERPGSLVERNVRALAQGIARHRNQGQWFFIRPFSEMNDSTASAPWEFGCGGRHNTPDALAAAWKALHRAFDREGATNAIFIFSPLAAHNVHREKEILETLNKIPVCYIDAFGLNLYSRPATAYGGASPAPIPFAVLAQRWIKVMEKSRHKGLPRAIAEMGVSNQAPDARRAQWLREAFVYARSHGFVMLTYFNYTHRYWQIDDDTQAGAALRAEMAQ